jgi:hypothetical protein
VPVGVVSSVPQSHLRHTWTPACLCEGRTRAKANLECMTARIHLQELTHTLTLASNQA